jgi:hypothetical protein
VLLISDSLPPFPPLHVELARGREKIAFMCQTPRFAASL